MNRFRLGLVFLIFLGGYFLVLGKAFYIQVLGPDKLITYSRSQLLREYKVYPNRGNILDRNGNPLAINIQTYNIFTLPKDLKVTQKSLKKLNKIVPQINYQKVMAKVKKRDKYTWVARKIKLNQAQVEEIQGLESLYLEEESSRVYPNHELLSQVLGFVGVDNDGLSGVEYQFNEKLRGDVKVVKYLKDAKGRPIKRESMDLHTKTEDLVLSIDKNIQIIAEKSLEEAVKEHRARKGGVGVMDVETGEILALANYPSFDPNSPKHSVAENRKLSFVTDPFEPGSVFKTLTIVSALENKVINSDTHYYCEKGRLQVEDHVISEAESNKKYEWLSVKEILKYSSNIGTTKIAFDLKFPKLRDSLELFRIGQKTGVEIPAESRGIFPKKENVQPLTLSNYSFGQGLATTGIQILASYAAIANKGKWVKPTLIKDGNKGVLPETIMSEETAKAVEEMLVEVVTQGTGTSADIPYYKIAGKTSTAQKAVDGGYAGYIPSFVGYPVNVEKKFVVFVYVDDPQNGEYYGNQVAAPVFKKIVQSILYKNKSVDTLASRENTKGITLDVVKTIQAKPRFIGKYLVPDFSGLDKKSAMELASQSEINIEHVGMGLVESQNRGVGSAISPNQVVRLDYKIPQYE